ncbi:MAG: hypothetical protein PHC88_12965 [Terrimicrobiaceae bacterium]|nr:hypothetical protein [Terrimicrobiaceae bacterium]
MNSRFSASLTLFGICGALLTACEPDDPAVRKELVEMRTTLANTRQELDETKAALAVAKAKADRANFLEADALAASLRAKQGELRRAIVQALPNYQLVTMSIGQVDTPFTSATPYAATIRFVVQPSGRDGRPASFVFHMLGGRDGAWLPPNPGEIAASVGGVVAPAAAEVDHQSEPGVPEDRGVRHIQWTDGGAAPAARPPAQNPQPSGQAVDPMPGSQETRRVNW